MCKVCEARSRRTRLNLYSVIYEDDFRYSVFNLADLTGADILPLGFVSSTEYS